MDVFPDYAGLREYFSQTDERAAAPRIPVMVNMTSASVSARRSEKLYGPSVHMRSASLDQLNTSSKNVAGMDEYSDEDEDYQAPDHEVCTIVIVLVHRYVGNSFSSYNYNTFF